LFFRGIWPLFPLIPRIIRIIIVTKAKFEEDDMQKLSNRRPMRSVSYVPVEEIVSGALQPRRHFTPEGLEELRDSIAEHGVIQPLTVRARGGRYELIAGERRLRAAKLAGLREVPCIIMDVDLESSGVIALIENIQRRDLDFVEEAEGISRLIRLFGMSQEEAARRLGKSQPAIANKLRILRLPQDMLEHMRERGLTERHARALLRLEDDDSRRRALDFMIEQRLTVAAAEEYVEALVRAAGEDAPGTSDADERCPPDTDAGPLRAAPAAAPETGGSASERSQTARSRAKKPLFVMKDVRVFMNSLNKSLDLMRRGGIDAGVTRSDTESEVVLTVRIPKR
jgi:ParB family chromosome partitioning protein